MYGRCENLTKPAGSNDATLVVAMGARCYNGNGPTRENIAVTVYRDDNAVERMYLSDMKKLFESLSDSA